jgi:hypothetical protein
MGSSIRLAPSTQTNLRQSPLLTHCDYTSRLATTRDRGRKELPFAGYSVVKEPAFATYGRSGEAGSHCCAPAKLPSAKRLRACLAVARSALFRERRLVENTGLEPVTSWLQTRRSPS